MRCTSPWIRRLAGPVIVPAVLAPLALGACGSDDDDDGAPTDPATAVVEYRYGDASVPPEYHRSYTLTVMQDEAHLVVDSYGDVLHDVTEPIDAATWNEVLAAASEQDTDQAGPSDGCSGGTTRELRVTDADRPESDPAVQVAVDVCGGDGGDEADAVDAVVAPVLARFDMDVLLATD